MNGQTLSSPDQTHALVVGIESYPRRKDLDLNGPACDAYRFAKWLRAQGVPATQIILLVSPLPKNKILFDERNENRVRDLGPIDCVVGPVTHEVIDRALEKLRNTSGLLFLFWTGHGIMTADGNRRPLLANYSDADKNNLDLDSLKEHLRSSFGQF